MSDRTRISLDGTWSFLFDKQDRREPAEVLAAGEWREAAVPMAWQAQFADLRDSSGTGWYRRAFTLDALPDGAAVLHFGAVDYHAAVWVNGQQVGEHEGGYLPFEFEVSRLLVTGENELVVRAVDPGGDSARWPDFPFGEVPHGKQSWYMPVGGIWQPVWLELRPRVHIDRLRLTPDPLAGSIEVTALVAAAPEGASVQLRVLAPGGGEAARAVIAPNRPERISLDRAGIRLWSPDDPALYTVEAVLLLDGGEVDSLSARCGFRTVESRDNRIFLNGQPVYLRSALDQAYYPETVYTVPSVEYLEDQFRKAKALGLNCLRTHIKIEDPLYYETADRLGLLIWTEIPNWIYLSPEAARRAKETFSGMVERDWNHPSIICWSLVNENWGTDLPNNPRHRAWLAQFYREAKAIDPHRLVVDNSACSVNPHVASDLEDLHEYRAIPDHADDWDAWVDRFASRQIDWLWAKDHLANRRIDAPLIVSEFGNWGLPDPRRLLERGADPWWFETGHNWGEGIVYPHNLLGRYADHHLEDVFGSPDQFFQASQEHMARSLAYELSSMRLRPEIGGYVITEYTDVHWECNGLMTMQREIKQGLDRYFVPLNQDQVLVIRPSRWSGKPGERVPVEFRCMGLNGPGEDGTVRWQVGGVSGELPAPGGLVEIPLPAGPSSALVVIEARWLNIAGQQLAQNVVEIACVAAPAPAASLVVPGDPALASALRRLGYTVTEQGAGPGSLVVARAFTDELRALAQDGARLLVLAGEEPARLPHMNVVMREGTPWQGDWATAFSWLRKTGPFAALPGGPLLEMEYAPIMPDAVITNLPIWAHSASWAGLALGWIHRVVSLLAKMPYGQGSVTATTFRLTDDALQNNAVAQALFAGLVELSAS